MLLNNKTLEAVIEDKISVVFRVWKRPTVRTGGTLTTRKGVLFIDSVDQIDRSKVTQADLNKAGLKSLDDLGFLDRDGDFYKITLHYHGEDPRVALRTNIDPGEVKAVCDKLNKMGEWGVRYLKMIHDQPNIHAQILADSVGIEKAKFKGRVRRLKTLGLTESLRPGYRLSVRGKAVLKRVSNHRTK